MQNLSKIVEKLLQLEIKDIKIDESLKNHTSIKIGGNADCFVEINSKKQILNVINFFIEQNINYYILGNGTNVLANDKGYRGVIISLSESLAKYRISKNGIFAQAGLGLFSLNKLCRKHDFGGLEFSYGIPGTVGGAVVMNAGSFGHSVSEFIEYVLVLENGKFKKIFNKDMGFTYRNSLVKSKKWIVIGAKFKLTKSASPLIENLQNQYFQKKLSTQPYTELSFGSVFKIEQNFEPVSKIIDNLGLKGLTFGGASISEKHAGFIINKGEATCKDCISLIQYIQKAINQNFGFTPKLEVKLLGEMDDIIW